MSKRKTVSKKEQDRRRRMKWWHEARFGMFIHYGAYSVLGRGEWAMFCERISVKEYEKVARTLKPKPGAAREWAATAKKAGMKYIVLTTKHHDGFCLWDSQQTDYNAVNYGPKRDLIAEYVDACREFGLKVGFYYSLMDWHHPDCVRSTRSEPARKRFVEFTHACVRELMSNYGQVDILWYDMDRPLKSAKRWESSKLNAMARKLQPGIIINNRSDLPEDFSTPEQRIEATPEGRAWEACMTFSGNWGWRPDPREDWASTRDVLDMLRQVTGGGGNLLLNVGPEPDGSVPEISDRVLTEVGRWIRGNEEAIYGQVDRANKVGAMSQMDMLSTWNSHGFFTRKGNTGYFWWSHCPPTDKRQIPIVDMKTKVKRVSYLKTGKPIKFTQKPRKILLESMPRANPDKIAGVTILKVEFASRPRCHPMADFVIT